jgi:hypothetical protein
MLTTGTNSGGSSSLQMRSLTSVGSVLNVVFWRLPPNLELQLPMLAMSLFAAAWWYVQCQKRVGVGTNNICYRIVR